MLTELAIKAAKPAAKTYRLTDGQSLYLLVQTDGARWWRWDYRRPSGKRNTLSLGVYPEVSLKKARERCQEARRALADPTRDQISCKSIELGIELGIRQ